MISKKQALAIAEAECRQRGWPWNPNTSVRWGLFHYTVWGGGRKGANLHLRIRKRDGKVLSVKLSPL